MSFRNRIDRISRLIDTESLKPPCPSCNNLGHPRDYFTPIAGDVWTLGKTVAVQDDRVDSHGRCVACGMLPDPYWAPTSVYHLELPPDIQTRLDAFPAHRNGVSR